MISKPIAATDWIISERLTLQKQTKLIEFEVIALIRDFNNKDQMLFESSKEDYGASAQRKTLALLLIYPKCSGRLISSAVNFGDQVPEKELSFAAANALDVVLMLVPEFFAGG